MERNGGVEEVATDKKRPREGNDGAAAAVAEVVSDVVPEQVNGAPADLERTDVKKAKIDVAASGTSVMDVVEERKDLESEIVETVLAKDGEWTCIWWPKPNSFGNLEFHCENCLLLMQ